MGIPTKTSNQESARSHGGRNASYWAYGATVARLTPDQKVGNSNLSALICAPFLTEVIQFDDIVCAGGRAVESHRRFMDNSPKKKTEPWMLRTII